VVRIPRAWFGPPEELVPFGPRAGSAPAAAHSAGPRAASVSTADTETRPTSPPQAGLRTAGGLETPPPPRPDAFWSENSAEIHDAVQLPGADEAIERARTLVQAHSAERGGAGACPKTAPAALDPSGQDHRRSWITLVARPRWPRLLLAARPHRSQTSFAVLVAGASLAALCALAFARLEASPIGGRLSRVASRSASSIGGAGMPATQRSAQGAAAWMPDSSRGGERRVRARHAHAHESRTRSSARGRSRLADHPASGASSHAAPTPTPQPPAYTTGPSQPALSSPEGGSASSESGSAASPASSAAQPSTPGPATTAGTDNGETLGQAAGPVGPGAPFGPGHLG
jgi:hypothetical protein